MAVHEEWILAEGGGNAYDRDLYSGFAIGSLIMGDQIDVCGLPPEFRDGTAVKVLFELLLLLLVLNVGELE